MRVIKDAYKEAKSKGLSPEQTADLILSRIMYYTEAVMDEVRSRTPDKYGASTIPQTLGDLMNPKSKEK